MNPRDLEQEHHNRILEKLRSKTDEIIKLQALARGFLQRIRYNEAIQIKVDEDFYRGNL